MGKDNVGADARGRVCILAHGQGGTLKIDFVAVQVIDL